MADVTTNAHEIAESLQWTSKNLPKYGWTALRAWSARDVMPALRSVAPSRRLRQAVTYRAYAHRVLPFARIFCRADLGAWFEFGTGIYGPLRRLIVPKGGDYVGPDGAKQKRRVLRIPTRSGAIYRPWSRGMRPRPWFFGTIESKLPLLRERLRETIVKKVRAAQMRASARAARSGRG